MKKLLHISSVPLHVKIHRREDNESGRVVENIVIRISIRDNQIPHLP